MPTYLVTDPDSGRKLRLTGDSPPTEQELEEIFSQQINEVDQLVGELEGVIPEDLPSSVSMANIGDVRTGITPQESMSRQFEHTVTSKPSEPEIGDAPELNDFTMPAFASSLGLLFSGETENAKKVLKSQFPDAEFFVDEQGNEKIKLESGAYRIRGPGQKTASLLAQALSFVPAGALATGFAQGAKLGIGGLAALEAAGAATTQAGIEGISGATGGEVEPENILISGVTAGGGTLVFGKLLEKLAKSSELKRTIADKIRSGDTSSDVAKYMLDGSGKVIKDKGFIKASQEAVKQGFDEPVIAMIKGATKTDRLKMHKMTQIAKKARKNALFAAKNRPTDVVGDSLMQRVRVIKKANQESGQRLDKVAKSLKGEKVDFSSAVQKFQDDLDSIGVTVNDDLSLNFVGSDIEGADAAQNFLTKLVKRMSSGLKGQAPDAYDVHRMKRFIDETVTYGKQAEGLAGKSEFIAKTLRTNLDEILDSNFDRYNKVNIKYSDTIRAINGIQDIAGRKIDLFGDRADQALGTLMRRTLSNAQSRIPLTDTIDQVDNVAKKYGGKFNDDLLAQAVYADELDRVFKPSARTSLKGEVGKEIERGVREAGSITTTGLIAKGAGKLSDLARGVNEENAFKAIENILLR